MTDASEYNITVRKGAFDGEICYEARVLELPDLAEYADSFEEAYALAIDAIEVTADVLPKEGKVMPQPMVPADDYSGRVTLRLPKTLHRALARMAELEDISLNQHLVNVLSFYTGFAQGFNSHPSSRQVWTAGLTKPQKPSRRSPRLKVVSTHKLQDSA